jgi:putative nucleotidyltransferase with HDIG domain
MSMSLTERAHTTLEEWVKSESLRKHCYAVAASMRHFAQRGGADADLWYAVGLLHDLDFEQYPQMPPHGDEPAAAAIAILSGEASEPPLRMHPFVGVAYLKEHGWDGEVCRAILSHADYSGVRPESVMEKTLCAVDELSSFVVAVALVRSSKSIFDVDVAAVRKKMKDKAFARAVSREDIARGAEMLELPLEELIDQVIAALRGAADQLGVRGQPTT